MQDTEFDIDRNAVKRYFLVTIVLGSFGILAFPLIAFSMMYTGTINSPSASGWTVLGTFILFFLIVSALFMSILSAFCLWLCPQQANNLHYHLAGRTLRADGGVFFLFRKSIPLERITDVALVQGPLLRYFNIWAMRIQTAGSAQCEATLYGVREPEKVRESILSQRQGVYGEKTDGV